MAATASPPDTSCSRAWVSSQNALNSDIHCGLRRDFADGFLRSSSPPDQPFCCSLRRSSEASFCRCSRRSGRFEENMETKLTLLLRVAGVLHLGLMCAGLLMPRVVGIRAHLAKMPPFIRQLFWVYYAFIGL